MINFQLPYEHSISIILNVINESMNKACTRFTSSRIPMGIRHLTKKINIDDVIEIDPFIYIPFVYCFQVHGGIGVPHI